MTEYTLICGDESIKVPSRFIHNCSAFTNMFEDNDSDNPDEPIPITDQFSKENVISIIEDLVITPRIMALEWSKITKQTPNLKVGYPGQHIASIITGVEGEKTAVNRGKFWRKKSQS